MDRHEPPNFYGANFPNQNFNRQGPDMMNSAYKNPYVNGAPDYPTPNGNGANQQQQQPQNPQKNPNAASILSDSSCTTALCKLNQGKPVTIYCTFTDSAEWHDKVFKGILFSASDDNIMLYNQQEGKFTIIVAVYVNFMEFYDINLLEIPKETKVGSSNAE